MMRELDWLESIKRGSIVTFAWIGSGMMGPGGLIACVEIVGCRWDLTFSRASICSWLTEGLFGIELEFKLGFKLEFLLALGLFE